MATIAYIMILGLPLVIWLGILTFLSLVTTATLGILVLKGLYNIPFRWHMRMAAVTVFFAVIHVSLVILQYFF